MTVRNLNHLCKPGSVVLIGASDEPRRSAACSPATCAKAASPAGSCWSTRTMRRSRASACHPDVASLPATPDLAVVATPPATVPGIIAALGARGAAPPW